MRAKLTTVFTVIGVVTVLVLAGNTLSIAATGKPFLVGKKNSASKVTSLARTTPGTALKVKTKSAADAPFEVNGKGKVTNLNVDTVDGLEGGTRALSWTFVGTTDETSTFTLTGIPVGTYLLTYSVHMGASTAVGATEATCFFAVNPPSGPSKLGGFQLSSQGTSQANQLSGTALMTTVAGGTTQLTCATALAGSWTATSVRPLTITAIPIAGVTNKGTPTVS